MSAIAHLAKKRVAFYLLACRSARLRLGPGYAAHPSSDLRAYQRVLLHLRRSRVPSANRESNA